MVSILVVALLVLLVVAVLIWAIQRYLPFDATLKNIACFVIVVLGLIIVLHRSGVL